MDFTRPRKVEARNSVNHHARSDRIEVDAGRDQLLGAAFAKTANSTVTPDYCCSAKQIFSERLHYEESQDFRTSPILGL